MRQNSTASTMYDGPPSPQVQLPPAGPELELDAVEFARVISGRGQGDGLLRTRVPF